MRTQITLYDEDSEQFEEVRQEMDELQPGAEPGNAEVLRRLMDMVDL